MNKKILILFLVLGLVLPLFIQPIIISDALVDNPSGFAGYWALDENTGTSLIDNSGLGASGTVVDATWTSGVYGYELSFSGSSQYAYIMDVPQLLYLNAITVSAWVYLSEALTNYEVIVSMPYSGGAGWAEPYSSYALMIDSDNGDQISFQVSISGTRVVVDGGVLVPLTQYHIIGTFSGSTLSIYVNGVLTGTESVGGSMGFESGGSHNLVIGGRNVNNNGQYFKGQIDDVRVYNVALTDAQANILFTQAEYEHYTSETYDAWAEAYQNKFVGETFTPSVSHVITGLKLLMFRVGTPGTVIVSLSETSGGIPVGDDLASYSFNGNSLTDSTSGQVVEINFASPVSLKAGTLYAFIVKAPSGTYPNHEVVLLTDITTLSYADGEFIVAYPGEQGWQWYHYTDTEAYFSEWGYVPTVYLEIQSNEFGTTNPVAGITAEDFMEDIPVTATPINATFYLAYWTLNNEQVGNANPYTVSMSANMTLKPHFEKAGYSTVIILPSDHVSTNLQSGGSYLYSIDTIFTITAYPDQGYNFDHWLVNGIDKGSNNPITFQLINNTYTIQPIVIIKTVTLTLGNLNGAYATDQYGDIYFGYTSYTFDYGFDLVLTYVSPPGVIFNGWTVNGVKHFDTTIEIILTQDTDMDNSITWTILPLEIEEGEPDFWFSFATALLPVAIITFIMGMVGNTITTRLGFETRYGWVGGGEVGLFLCAYSGLLDPLYFTASCVIVGVTIYYSEKRG